MLFDMGIPRLRRACVDRQLGRKDTPMQELLTFVAKSLVDHPDQVVVRETEAEAIILELSVADEDMGKVIGKQGRIAKAIRTVIKAATAKNSKPVYVEIVEDEK